MSFQNINLEEAYKLCTQYLLRNIFLFLLFRLKFLLVDISTYIHAIYAIVISTYVYND